MSQSEVYYYWSAKYGQIMTSKEAPWYVNGEGAARYIKCEFLSFEDATAANFGRPATWLGRYSHGRDLHPVTAMEILAIQAHSNPVSIMPRAY